MGWPLSPVEFDEQVVLAEFLAMKPVAENAVLLDRNTNTSIPRMNDVGTTDRDVATRDPPRQQWLVAILEAHTVA